MQPVDVLNVYRAVFCQNRCAGWKAPVNRIAREGSSDTGGQQAAPVGGHPLAHLAGVVADGDSGDLGVVPGESTLGERQRGGVRRIGVAEPGLALEQPGEAVEQRLGLAVLGGNADQGPDALPLGDSLEQVGQPGEVPGALPSRGDRGNEPLKRPGQALAAAALKFRRRFQEQVVVD